MNPIELVIIALATWRLSSLFANESGPFHIFKIFREWICKTLPGVGEGLTCEWCNSVWFGTALTILYLLFKTTLIWILLPLAFSTIVVMIKFTVQPKEIRLKEKV